MNQFLILDFQNAKWFQAKIKADGTSYQDTTDKSFDYGKNIEIKRANLSCYKEPITVHQISNMLHVLFNERPVPKNRTISYGRIEYLFDKALQSYLRINELGKNEEKKGDTVIVKYDTEVSHIKKSLHDSFGKYQLTWVFIKRYLRKYVDGVADDSIYDEFRRILKSMNIDESLSVEEVSAITHKSYAPELTAFLVDLSEKGKTPMRNAFIGDKKHNKISFTGFGQSKTTPIMVNTGVDEIVRLSGRIAVPVNNDDIEKLRGTKGCARILEDGLVTIKGITPYFYPYQNNYIPVKDISLEEW